MRDALLLATVVALAIGASAHGGTDANRASPCTEALVMTHSVRDEDKTYQIEFYYRELYGRLRARVLVDGRELRGLVNRFYGIDSWHNIRVFSTTRQNDGSIELFLNCGWLRLKEYPVNMEAIYGAAEAFVHRHSQGSARADVHVNSPSGLLEKTRWVRIFAPFCGGDYLIDEEGHVAPLTLENLRIAHCAEGITARDATDYERIAQSIIATEHRSSSRDDILFITRAQDIPGYDTHPLDSDSEAEIGPARVYRDADGQTDYWECCTYEQYHGVVARYTFGFRDTNPHSVEKMTLGENIGKAYHLCCESHSVSGGPAPGIVARMDSMHGCKLPQWFLGAFRAALITTGMLLLLLAHIIRTRTH